MESILATGYCNIHMGRGTFCRMCNYQYITINQGPFSISLLKLSQLKAKSLSQLSNLLQTHFLSHFLFRVQASDLGEILTSVKHL